MPKGTMLDRLAGAMKTLGKREGKALTPRQRVAAAQRWNSLADIGEDKLATLDRLSEYPGARGHEAVTQWNQMKEELEDLGFLNEYAQRADNPFRFDWMGVPYQYEARLKNYKPLTDAQYERMLELEEEARQRDLDAIHQEWYDDFIEPWRH